MKKTPKPVSDYYAELGRKSAKARAKKILEKAKVEKKPTP